MNGETADSTGRTLAELRRRLIGAPDDPQALTALFAALDSAQRAGTPQEAVARSNFGERLRRQGQLAAAEHHLRRAVDWLPDFGGNWFNLGVLLQATGRLEEAAASFAEADRRMPDFAGAFVNHGAVLRDLGRLDQAEAVLRASMIRHPQQPAAWANLAAVRLELNDTAGAVNALRRLLALVPAMGEGWANLGAAWRDGGQGDLAIFALQRALVCGVADSGGVLAQLIQQKRHLCHWDGLEEDERALVDMVRQGASRRIHPWIFLNMGAGRALEAACASRYTAWRTLGSEAMRQQLPPTPTSAIGDTAPLRIGYLSADFHDHATAVLLAEVLERHDRRRVSVHAYSYGPADDGPMRRRLRAACDGFNDISALGHLEAASQIGTDGIQILVDLKGHTQGARPMIPALRPAPVQVQWLGYPGTMGAPFIDYILADAVVAPFAHQADFAERVIHLPDSYQPNDRTRAEGETLTRESLGLPEQGIIYCCFNACYKFSPQVFDLWSSILLAVPESSLWLLAPAAGSAARLREQMVRRGVAAERLRFTGKKPLPDYLAQYRCADLFLDTWPVGAHTTASDALWAGLPVLTWLGDSFAGRVGASLLQACGMAELVTASPSEYAERAIALGRNPARLTGLHQRLESERLRLALFDTPRFVRGLEDAYARIWQSHRAGLPPRGFSV